jgi:glycosyltransferase involved in cell wall biosynthesis
MVRKHHIDILHSQGARADFFCRLAAKLARFPRHVCTIAMPVEGFDVPRWKKMIYLFADKATQRFVTRFIVVSDALRKMYVEGRGIEERRVVCIYNGVEPERFSPVHPGTESSGHRAIRHKKISVGCFGRLVWQKGIEYLIRAIPEVVSEVAPVHFLMVGDGPERDRLETMAAEMGIGDCITFTGFMEDVLPLLSRVNVVVIPSVKEGFPMISLEAMAMAKPIVATQIEGITEQLQHRRSALLVPPKSSNALAKAIVALLREKSLAAALGREARKVVQQRFTLQNTITATQDVYEALL